MDYVYGVIWLVISLLLIFRFSKENKIFYVLGGYFLIMAGWWIANPLIPDINILEGTYGMVLRGIGAVALAIVGIFYFKNIYKKEKK